ncbi:hypothetical protein ACFLYA_00565 [Candidatus Dependentiae bacterium]
MRKTYIKKIVIMAIFALSGHIAYGLEVFAIPGQNGLGSSPEYVKKCLGSNKISVKKVKTPSKITEIDLGQKHCIKYLRNALASDKTNNVIIHATSQGTATALNYLATEDKGKKIKALILEAVLISGNDAIFHTLKGDLPCFEYLPFSYYFLPYCAKVQFPCYRPTGIQVIKTLKQIPTDIPIIIIHSQNDRQLSYKGALALYYGLRANGNNNVYLLSQDGRRHIEILDEKPEYQKIVQSILKKHNVLPKSWYQFLLPKKNAIDLSLFQPNHNNDRFRKPYQNLVAKEKWHKRLWNTVVLGGITGITALAYCCSKKLGWTK